MLKTDLIKKTLFWIIVLQVIVTSILMYLGHYQHVTVLEMMMKEEERRASNHQKTVFEQINREYIHYGKDLLEKRDVIEAFASGDRQRLLELCLPVYKLLREKNPYLYVMHFHTPDTHSFLRVHKPQKYGDDLSTLRPIIVDTNLQKKVQTGFEIGKYGIYYRITFPVFKDDKHIGAFEFGIDVKYLLEQFALQSSIRPVLLIRKDMGEPIFKYHQKADAYLVSFNADYAMVRYDLKHEKNFMELLDARITKHQPYLVQAHGVEHLVFNGKEFFDYSKRLLGRFIFIEEIDYYMQTIKVIRWVSILTTLFLLLVVIVLTYWLIRNYSSTLLQHQARLSKLSEMLTNVLRGANLGYWDWHIQTHRHEVNDRWLEILGLKRNETKGSDMDWSERVHPDDAEWLRVTIEKAIAEDRPYRVEFRMRHKDGHYVWIEGSGAVVERDAKGEPLRLSGTHQDISRRKAMEEESNKNRQYRDALFSFNPNIIVVTDGERMIDANQTFFDFFKEYRTLDAFLVHHQCVCDLFEYSDDPDYLHPSKGNWIDQAIENCKAKAIVTVNGKRYYFGVNASKVELGEEAYYLATLTDFTREQELNQQLERLALIDPLTQVYNRRQFSELFDREIRRAKREDKTLIFMMVDIDQFKKYNDTYGHDRGDEVLITIAKCMQAQLKRPGDYLFRLGGEEFGIVFGGLSMDDAYTYAEIIRQSVQELAIEHEGNLPYLVQTVSIGFCFVDYALEDMEGSEIYRLADQALYEAKDGGRNRVVSIGA